MTASSSLPYLVCGVTGRTGAAAADALLRAGQPVRVLVRDPARGRPWAERGAEVAVADLGDLPAMVSALSEVRGAYVLSPQQYDRDDLFEHAALIADITARAAVAARVPRLVALSSVGADRDSGTGWIAMNRLFEQRLAATGVPVTFLRAAYFMENWMPMVKQAVHGSILPSFLAPPRRQIPMVATADVGSAAAALLQEEPTGVRIVTLSGPQDYAPVDVVAAIAAELGKPVDVAVLPETQWRTALADAHFSAAALAGFTEMTQGLNSGHIAIDSDPAVARRAGTTRLEHVVAAAVAAAVSASVAASARRQR